MRFNHNADFDCCFQCKERHVGCHAACDEYKTRKEKYDAKQHEINMNRRDYYALEMREKDAKRRTWKRNRVGGKK